VLGGSIDGRARLLAPRQLAGSTPYVYLSFRSLTAAPSSTHSHQSLSRYDLIVNFSPSPISRICLLSVFNAFHAPSFQYPLHSSLSRHYVSWIPQPSDSLPFRPHPTKQLEVLRKQQQQQQPRSTKHHPPSHASSSHFSHDLPTILTTIARLARLLPATCSLIQRSRPRT
jgi:hypothetical protein